MSRVQTQEAPQMSYEDLLKWIGVLYQTDDADLRAALISKVGQAIQAIAKEHQLDLSATDEENERMNVRVVLDGRTLAAHSRVSEDDADTLPETQESLEDTQLEDDTRSPPPAKPPRKRRRNSSRAQNLRSGRQEEDDVEVASSSRHGAHMQTFEVNGDSPDPASQDVEFVRISLSSFVDDFDAATTQTTDEDEEQSPRMTSDDLAAARTLNFDDEEASVALDKSPTITHTVTPTDESDNTIEVVGAEVPIERTQQTAGYDSHEPLKVPSVFLLHLLTYLTGLSYQGL